MIQRSTYLQKIDQQFKSHPIVALLSPRQCGKTTMARQYMANKDVHFFDLEDSRDVVALSQPHLALGALRGLIIIDEIQRLPDLFLALRVLADEKQERQFLILGSASRDLIRQSFEILAGRIAYIEVHPFSLAEVDNWHHLHLLGGFPNSYLHPSTAHDWWNNISVHF